ncbi:MAG TPA: DUF6370 family protein [Flavobacterium sp.]|jgi:hypothetical protein
MKKGILFVFFMIAMSASAQEKQAQVVQASCGQCNFGMKTQKGCDLAVKIDGKSYFVDGVKLDDHGDAHASDGFCSAVRKAEVTGNIVGDRFKATSFKLLPLEATAKQ